MTPRTALLIGWFFMTFAAQPGASNAVATQGPFNSHDQCEWGRSYVTGLRVATSPCWSDGR